MCSEKVEGQPRTKTAFVVYKICCLCIFKMWFIVYVREAAVGARPRGSVATAYGLHVKAKGKKGKTGKEGAAGVEGKDKGNGKRAIGAKDTNTKPTQTNNEWKQQ